MFFVFVLAHLQTFMIVDNILIGLVNEISFRKSGFVWKVATSCSGGWNYFGRERWGCLWLAACLLGCYSTLPLTHPPSPPLSSVGQTQIRFLVPKFGLEIWPIFTSTFFKRVGRMIIMAALYQVYAYYSFWWKVDYLSHSERILKSTKNECFVCRFSFQCDNITKANH